MKRIKELLTRRILLEAGAWIAGTALLFWWLLPTFTRWWDDVVEGAVPFIAYAIEGIIRWPI